MCRSLQLCFTALLAASVAAALSVQAPTAVASTQMTNITWTPDQPCTPFSVELVHKAFHDTFAIANNVNCTLGQISVVIPDVPSASDYSLEFVNVTDINDVFATSPGFSIAPAPSTSSAPQSSTASVQSDSGLAGSATSTTPANATPSSPAASAASVSGSVASVASSAASSAASAASSNAAVGRAPGTAGAALAVSVGLLAGLWV